MILNKLPFVHASKLLSEKCNSKNVLSLLFLQIIKYSLFTQSVCNAAVTV